MLFTTAMLIDRYGGYKNPLCKIKRMADKGEIFKLKRGLYETDGNVPGQCLAGALYGPSYLSFDYALAYYGLIPERVYEYTCATFEKKKGKLFENHFGRFSYRDIPSEAYPHEVVLKEEAGYPYAIATPEKALCDRLYAKPPVLSQRDIQDMLFEDMRIDEEDLFKLDIGKILILAPKYHDNNLKHLAKFLAKEVK